MPPIHPGSSRLVLCILLPHAPPACSEVSHRHRPVSLILRVPAENSKAQAASWEVACQSPLFFLEKASMIDDFWGHGTVSKLGSPLFGISVSPNSLGVECSGVFSRQGVGREDGSSILRSTCGFLSPTHLWGDLEPISGL